jgi:hypothetical protein
MAHALLTEVLLVFDTCFVRDEDVWYLDSNATRHVTLYTIN